MNAEMGWPESGNSLFARLQWGRVRMNAEIWWENDAASMRRVLQWGRVRMNAEMIAPAAN